MKTEDFKNTAEPILAAHKLFLVDLKISKDNVVEIFVDAMEGVNIQTCMAVSREIESKMDRDKEDFELTVSSAGIGYPFKVDGQFQKNIGKTVEAKLSDNSKLTGTLLSFDQECILLECEEKQIIEGSKKKQLVKVNRSIRRSEVKEIKDVVIF